MKIVEVECPECGVPISVAGLAEEAYEIASFEGGDSYNRDSVVCGVCKSVVEVDIECEISYSYNVLSVSLLEVGTKSDGRYEINGEIIVVEDGEIIERYMLPDENQMALPI